MAMISHQTDKGYLLVLHKGEQLVAELTNFCNANKILSGWVSGMGGTTSAELGYYDLDSKQYIYQKLANLRELLSLSGNVSTAGDETILHLHAVVSGDDLTAKGGHLKELTVGGTCEVLIQPFNAELKRQVDDATGLNLIQ